jgi:branched-chain amino acid transport system permease protein
LRSKKFLAELIVITAALAVIPAIIHERYTIHIVVLCMIFGVVASNWNLAIGYAGVFHLAQVPFFVAGAYASAIPAFHWAWTPWIGLILGGVVAVILSIIIGVPALRVRGLYLVFLTFAFHFILASLILYFVDLTGGDMGLQIPPYKIGDFAIDLFNITPAYYMALILFVLSLLLVKIVIDSDIGLALVGLRDSELYAISRGVHPYKYKLAAFVLSAFLTGVSGAFYAHYLRVVTPALFGWSFLQTFLGSIVIGGIGTLYGPILGAFILTFLSEYLRFLDIFRNIVFGILMILILIFLPQGLITLRTRLRFLIRSASKS